MKKSDINIELLRVVCAVLVIFTHVLNRYLFSGGSGIRDKVCLLNSLCISAVPCFLMITGYFTRRGQSWVKKLRKTVTVIVIPALITALISVMIFPWICRRAGFIESIRTADYRAILPALASWRLNTLPGSSHLWYITDYCRLMLLFPLLSYLCCDDKNARTARWLLYAMYFPAVAYTDLRQLFPQIPNVYTYTLIDSRIMFFLLGYEFNGIRGSCLGLALKGAVTAAAGCAMMWVMTRLKFALTGELSDFFFHYQTIPCLIASAGTFALFISLRPERLPEAFRRGIFFLGRQTWVVYLIHLMALNYLRSLPGGSRADLRYLVQLTVMTVICSFAAAAAINFVRGAFGRLCRPADI